MTNSLKKPLGTSKTDRQEESFGELPLSFESKNLEILSKASTIQKVSKWLLLSVGIFGFVLLFIINSIDNKFEDLAQKSTQQTEELSEILSHYKEFRKTLYSSLPSSNLPNIAEDEVLIEDSGKEVSIAISSLKEESETSEMRHNLMLGSKSSEIIKASAIFTKQRNGNK